MTSYNPMAWVVKRQKLHFKKVFFWNTLVWTLKRVVETKKDDRG